MQIRNEDLDLLKKEDIKYILTSIKDEELCSFICSLMEYRKQEKELV